MNAGLPAALSRWSCWRPCPEPGLATTVAGNRPSSQSSDDRCARTGNRTTTCLTINVGAMIEARKASVWKNRYDIIADGRRLATWDGSSWKAGGTVELDGRHYEVRANMWGSTYAMVDEDGTRIASADHVGRKNWTVEADGRTFEFRRASWWRQEEELHSEGLQVGSVKRNSMWRGDAVADLPGLPLSVEVFVLAVALTKWDSEAASAG